MTLEIQIAVLAAALVAASGALFAFAIRLAGHARHTPPVPRAVMRLRTAEPAPRAPEDHP